MKATLVLCAPLLVFACGGDVVVDDGGGGSDGASSSSTAPGTGGAAPSGCISVPEVTEGVGQCTADPGSCSISCPDAGHAWQVKCFEKACQCIYDNQVICLCAVSGSEGSICNGDLPPCCPAPWINP